MLSGGLMIPASLNLLQLLKILYNEAAKQAE
jgi:hypothetical protein